MMSKFVLYLMSITLVLFSCNTKPNPNCKNYEELMKYGENEDSITVKLKFMAYPCGDDCVLQYRVDSVLYSENGSYKFYLNKEIGVEMSSKKMQKLISEKKDCIDNNSEYIYTGYFKRNGLGMGRLDILDGKINCSN